MLRHNSVRDILRKPAGTPRILVSLDGGGVRGILTVQVLRAIENLMRRRWGDPNLVLADCVDYFGGTSTGGIIAAGLAVGEPVERIHRLYLEEFPRIFRHARVWNMRRGLHERHPVLGALKRVFGDQVSLGSEQVRTLLMLGMRNATTDSPWPVSNNPLALFNQADRADNNLKLPLWQLVRASAAAPMFFPPEEIQLPGRQLLFVDGALTPYNNPALQLYLMATEPAYRLSWQRGEDRLLLVSIGTGMPLISKRISTFRRANLFNQAGALLPALMNSMSIQQDQMCRLLGRCRHGDPIDEEIGDQIAPPSATPKQFSYIRINVELSTAGLTRLAGDLPPDSELRAPLQALAAVAPTRRLERINRVANAPDLTLIGNALAQAYVKDDLFDGFLPPGG